MKQKKRGNGAGLAAGLGFPCEAMPQTVQVLLLGEEHLRAQPCQRLLRYSETEISAQLGRLCLLVCGSNLQVESFCNQTLELGGRIVALQWQQGKGEGEKL